MNDTNEFYPVIFRLDQTDFYVIWVSGDTDRLVISSAGKVATFSDQQALAAFSSEHGITLINEEAPLYDFDALADWLTTPTTNNCDCELLLQAWNMLVDVASSLGRSIYEPQGADAVYDKLFWGNNLEPVTPKGKRYTPQWSTEEVNIITCVLCSGLKILKQEMQHTT